MADAPQQAAPGAAASATARRSEIPSSIKLISYPKIVFLYPSILVALVAAVVLSFLDNPLDAENQTVRALNIVFLVTMGVNLVILSFDFPRTTSLTLFFFAAALVLGFLLLMVYQPEVLPWVAGIVSRFRPLANATFYWTFCGVMSVILLLVMVSVRFDYWEVRPNELLHHHGVLSNLERVYAPNLRIEKEITDVFEYLLLRSGRLILQPSSERRAIILENIPFISRKESSITRMLGALQVEVRAVDDAGP